MLFDLRARGRRRTVQVVYLGLAILFGIGFIGFGVGVGGGGGGSPIEAIFGKSESNGAGYAKQIAAAEKRTRIHPSEAAAWAKLAEARLHEANGSEFYDEATQQFTSKGKQLLTKVVAAWNRYVALNPSNPPLTIGEDMLRVFGEEGLNEPAQAVAVLELLIPSRPPSAALYGDLAKYAYQAKNAREGDLASAKAVSLSPAADRAKVQAELEEIKKNPTGGSSPTYTGTTNGKVYSVKVGPKGEGTVVKTSTAPATTKTATTKK
jgi:hypothetical protein